MPDRPISTPTGEDRAKSVENAVDSNEEKHLVVARNDIEEEKHEVLHKNELQSNVVEEEEEEDDYFEPDDYGLE